MRNNIKACVCRREREKFLRNKQKMVKELTMKINRRCKILKQNYFAEFNTKLKTSKNALA